MEKRKELRDRIIRGCQTILTAQKGMWNLAMKKIMKERGELPNEEGEEVREYKAMHGEDFWSSWPREDERGNEERMAKADRNEEEEGEKRKRKRNGDSQQKM